MNCPHCGRELSPTEDWLAHSKACRILELDIRDLVAAIPEPTEDQIAIGERALDEYYEGGKDAPLEGSIAYVWRAMKALERAEPASSVDHQQLALCDALRRVLADIAAYERMNNLAPNPGRDYCWDSVAQAHAVLYIHDRDETRALELRDERGET